MPLLAVSEGAGGHHDVTALFLMLGVLLVAALIGNLVERIGQPAVVGQLLAGIGLSAILYFTDWQLLADLKVSETFEFLAEVGAVVLLFHEGLKNRVVEMRKVGGRAVGVALIGVILPFIAGWLVMGPAFFGDESTEAHLFLGAALVATSVGITVKVFDSVGLGKKNKARQTVLGAAVIDDIGGLVILAVIIDIASGGEVTVVSVAVLIAKAVGFLVAALLIGPKLMEFLSRFICKLNPRVGSKMLFSLSVAILVAYAGTLVGLAPIIGAFAAGLLLEHVHFERFEGSEINHDLVNKFGQTDEVEELSKELNEGHVEDLIEKVSQFLTPLFFVFVGLKVEFVSLLDLGLWPTAIAITVVAIFAKALAGVAAEGGTWNKVLVGLSMVPRGEVGLIFAGAGLAQGVLGADLFSTILIVVVLTTLVSPFMIKYAHRRAVLEKPEEAHEEKEQVPEPVS